MKKLYLVSQVNNFELMTYAQGPKDAAKRVADFKVGKGKYRISPTKKPLPKSYKVSLAGASKTSVSYYDIIKNPM